MLAGCAPLLLSVQPFARKIVVPAGAALPPIATGDTLTGQQLAQTFTAEAAVTDDTLYEQLRDGGWRPLTGRDLELSAALNAGYLLRVALDRPRLSGLDPSISADFGFLSTSSTDDDGDDARRAKNWRSGLPSISSSDPFGGRLLAFARGHGVQTTRDRYWFPKLVYLQAALLTDTPLAALGRYAAGVNVTSDALAPFESAVEGNTQTVDRVSIADVVDLRETGGKRRLLSSLFRRCELVEPTFDELLLVWRRKPLEPPRRGRLRRAAVLLGGAARRWARRARPWEAAPPDDNEAPPPPPPAPQTQMEVFENLPIANLGVVLPNSRVTFRAADALRLDLISVVTLAYLLFTSRLLLGARLNPTFIATISLCLWLLRTTLGYSNALARLELLRSRFRDQHLVLRGAATVAPYLRQQAADQRARRAAALLADLRRRRRPASRADLVIEPPAPPEAAGAELDVDGALDDLLRLAVVEEVDSSDGGGSESFFVGGGDGARLLPKPPDEADAALQSHWAGLLRRALKQPVEAPPPPPPPPNPAPSPEPSADAAPSDAPAPRPRRWKFWSSDLQPPPSMPLEEDAELSERDLW